MAFNSGSGENPSATLKMLSPTVTVTISSANQAIDVVATKFFGSTTTGVSLDLFICSQPSVGGALTTWGGGMLGGRIKEGRAAFTVPALIWGIPNGTYKVGLCGKGGSGWNSNEWAYVTARVLTT